MRLRPLGKGDVLVANGRIAALSLAGDAPIEVSGIAGLEIIECDGLSMAPGFIDQQHSHHRCGGGNMATAP